MNEKQKVLNHYGNFCKCYGVANFEFLTVDHINNDGAEHRRKNNITRSMYRWLIKNNFPKGFQILCFNCNCSKHYYGICPHKLE